MARRFRFSARTLAIFVALVCAYFGAWEATKKYGIPRIVARGLGQDSIPVASPVPFVLHSVEYDLDSSIGPYVSRYHAWLMGATIKLPFDTQWTGDVWFDGALGPLEMQQKQRAPGKFVVE